MKRPIIVCIVFFIFTSFNLVSDDNKSIVESMIAKKETIKEVGYTMIMRERFENEIIYNKAQFKVSYGPLKVYVKILAPKEGIEILYVEGQNEGKALVKPNSFPWTNLNLDPLGNTLRKDFHHSLFKSGYRFYLEVLEDIYINYIKNGKGEVKDLGMVKYGGILCHKLSFKVPGYKHITYEVKKGDTPESISWDRKISDYSIIELNDQIDGYDDLREGMHIKIPNCYAKEFIFYVDKDRKIPLGMKSYDEKGLFEEYSFLDVVINPGFESEEFRRTNTDYGF